MCGGSQGRECSTVFNGAERVTEEASFALERQRGRSISNLIEAVSAGWWGRLGHTSEP